MTTWANLRTRVRIMLSDTGGTRWVDDELLSYVEAALGEYSRYFPLESAASPTGSAGVYTVEFEWEIRAVSHLDSNDDEQILEELHMLPGRGVHQETRGWWRVENTLYVRPTDLASVMIYIKTRHTVPTAGSSVLTILPGDEQMIIDFICGMAAARISLKTALLDRWKGSGKRDDNPVEVPRVNFRKNFERAVLMRLGHNTIRKFIPGRDRPERQIP